MRELEISAKTVEEAIQHALDQLGVSQEEVEVTVLKEGRSGIMGLGAEEARIKVRPLSPTAGESITETAKGILESLLARIGVDSSVEPQPAPPLEEEKGTPPVAFDIKGEDLGILIGRQGQTLACLQYIVRLIVAHKIKTWVPVVVDVEGYRQRRSEKLRALASRIAELVKVKRTPFTLRPMPAYERRIIHLALVEHPDVTTESTGEGESRRVVILPKGQPPKNAWFQD